MNKKGILRTIDLLLNQQGKSILGVSVGKEITIRVSNNEYESPNEPEPRKGTISGILKEYKEYRDKYHFLPDHVKFNLQDFAMHYYRYFIPYNVPKRYEITEQYMDEEQVLRHRYETTKELALNAPRMSTEEILTSGKEHPTTRLLGDFYRAQSKLNRYLNRKNDVTERKEELW